MREWLKILPFPVLIFSVLTVLDYSAQSGTINWISNIAHAVLLTAIGCVGQYLIHKNILQQENEDADEENGCIGCGKTE